MSQSTPFHAVSKIHWQTIINLAGQHKSTLIQAHIIAIMAALILVRIANGRATALSGKCA